MNKKFIAIGLFFGTILFTIIVFFDYRSKRKSEEELAKINLEETKKQRFEDSISNAEQEEIQKINQAIRNQEEKDSIELNKNLIYKDSLRKSQINLIQYKINKTIKDADCENNELSLSFGYDGKISIFYNNKLRVSLMYDQIEFKTSREENLLYIKTKSTYYDPNTGIEVLQSNDFSAEVCIYSIEAFNEAYEKYLDFVK